MLRLLTGLSSVFWNGDAVISTSSSFVEDSISFMIKLVGLLDDTIISEKLLGLYPIKLQVILYSPGFKSFII